MATVKNPLLSLRLLSFTLSINAPLAGILIGWLLDPIGNGALLPTWPMSPPTGIALTEFTALLSVSLPSGL
jgi:hypothetical protein